MFKNVLKPLKNKKNSDVSPQDFQRELEIDVLARTLYGEARGEGPQGMEAVAAVVLNRVATARRLGGYWWGMDIIQVCQKPYQFSCWNKDDPNFNTIQSVTEKDIHFATALRIARRAVSGVLEDPSGGATHYHAKGIEPYWAANLKPVKTIGSHIFYQLIEI